ncbi:FtsK/SpoIIIE domain-containing protein [Myceligenerans indicum]|uniref:FtsK/SpoIIIE domain-containing protein n=1 Tax=Myceligenerans indicum TaxID=2593663 RepID=UPI00191E9450|nr:FtsK/SpoIIIE domain-containing protein [Myceligenerans indicum]
MTVRMTVHPDEDVELSDGAPPAAFREPLAALIRRPELRHAALLADGAPVPEDCRAGERPLLPGATLTIARHGASAARHEAVTTQDGAAPLRARWMLARTTGTAAGAVIPVRGPRDLVRGLHGLAREHATRSAAGGPGLRVRRGGVSRTLGPPRQSGDAARALGLLPVVGSVCLALLLRQPTLALFALFGIAALLPQLFRRRTAPGTAPARVRPHRAGPDALLAFVTAAHQAAPGTWRTALAAWTRAEPRHGWPGGTWDELLNDGALAVAGPDEAARAVARAVVADLATRGRPVQVLGAVRHWTWCRWLPSPATTPTPNPPGHHLALPAGRAADEAGLPVLVVDHGTPEDHAAARSAVARGAVAVVLGTTRGCRTIATVRNGRLHVTGPELNRRSRPVVGVTTAWAELFARRLAGARHLGRTLPTLTGSAPGHTQDDTNLPDDVPLAGLHDLDGVSAGRRSGSWAVPLGRTTTGTVTWDIVSDGPHLLVAGTTGSGKSELLRALVLGLALQHPPGHLMLGLVDFKGGAGLGELTGLPHVVGQVTDLDATLAARALTGLQSELRRRKRILAEHGVADVAALARDTMPRLVVVVDEFRALADELPELLPGLVRIAAQGRSLGVHLVLATQRPAGAVNADVRANVTTRLALRVTDPLESRDVVDCPDAAALPVDRPGRAVLRIGADAPVLLQCAHTGPGRPIVPVRRAPSFRLPGRAQVGGRLGTELTGTVPGAAGAPGRHLAGPGHAGPGSDAGMPAAPPGCPTEVVAALRDAYGGSVAHAPLWLPPLPDRVESMDLPQWDDHPHAPGLPLALGDLPERQRRRVIRWDPAHGNLAVVGRARSGRTTALAALAAAARAAGLTVRTVTPVSAPEPVGAPDLLLVDGLEAIRAAWPGWEPPVGVPVAAATRSLAAAHAYGIGPRLVMLSRDRADDVALGAPAALAGSGGVPGRAAWCDREGAVLCQTVQDTAVT